MRSTLLTFIVLVLLASACSSSSDDVTAADSEESTTDTDEASADETADEASADDTEEDAEDDAAESEDEVESTDDDSASTDDATADVTTGDWKALVVHQAPLNTDCESSGDPDAECEFLISDTPSDWTAVDFDDSGWGTASVWDSAAVDPKIGYDDITWDGDAQFLWGSDLDVDNTVLLRTTVTG